MSRDKELEELYERRKDTTDFSSGDELATGSLEIFEERKEDIRRFLEENQGKV